MKVQKILIRVWLAGASLTIFAGGWIALAHSPKPVSAIPSQTYAIPTPQPVPSLDELSTGERATGPLIMQAPVPLLRTRGS